MFILFQLGFVSDAHADLNQLRIRTIEWLVDNSDVIAIYRFGDEQRRDAKLLRVLKGDAKTLKHPLLPTEFDGYHHLEIDSDGSMRLCFVRGDNELLEEIALDREPIIDTPTFGRLLYGVTQYGQLLHSQQALFQRIDRRIESGPGKPVRPNQRRHHARASGIEASADFPLESSGKTYVLIVPFNEERRDHFCRLLQVGDASQRIAAINELRNFDDAKAIRAIRDALDIGPIQPSYRYYPSGEVRMDRDDVISTAKLALRSFPE